MNETKTIRHIPMFVIYRRGFTLLELLVVVAIIMILAGFFLPAFLKMKKAARIKRANSDVVALVSAIQGYQVVYHKWPGNADGGTWSNDNYTVINQLANNPQKRIFFEASSTSKVLLDHFGNPYCITIAGENVNVWSYGPDGTNGTGDEISMSY